MDLKKLLATEITDFAAARADIEAHRADVAAAVDRLTATRAERLLVASDDELDEIEGELGALYRQLDKADAAIVELGRREKAAREAADAERRARRLEEMNAILDRRVEAAAAADAALAALVKALDGYDDTISELVRYADLHQKTGMLGRSWPLERAVEAAGGRSLLTLLGMSTNRTSAPAQPLADYERSLWGRQL